MTSSGARRCSSLARFKTTTSGGKLRSLKDYVASLKENQTAIYYLTGAELARLEASPHLEGFRARGVEVLLLTDPIDSLWVTSAPYFEGKPFKSITPGRGGPDAHCTARLRSETDW